MKNVRVRLNQRRGGPEMMGVESEVSEFQSAEHVVRPNQTSVESDAPQVESDELRVGLKESAGGFDVSELRLKQARVRRPVTQVGSKMMLFRPKPSGGGPKVWEVESDERGIQSARRQFQS